jgi:hypothetical protein
MRFWTGRMDDAVGAQIGSPNKKPATLGADERAFVFVAPFVTVKVVGL